MGVSRVRRIRRLVRALAGWFWRGLVAAGSYQITGEAIHAAAVLDAPPPGHPERLCPNRPLTALERTLLKELDLAR
ncbi:DUF6059 family protein [Streptomyces sp. NPDC088387]|uniref:DUF6059 family protein n=1 Tax=Streptomyces sp. NPDC088387 TaxID=3365859 RepID=UPI0038092F36